MLSQVVGVIGVVEREGGEAELGPIAVATPGRGVGVASLTL